MRSNIIFCDICCFSSATSCATSLPSSLGALQIQDRSPQSRPVASRNQSQTHSDATDLNCGDQSQFSGICNAPLGLALHCYKVYAKINTKIGNSIPCKIVTPENFSSKVCTRDYVGDDNYILCRFWWTENRFSGRFSPSRWSTTPCVLSCPFFSGAWSGRTGGPIFTLYDSNDVFPHKEVPFGVYNDRWRHLEKYAPKTPQKWAWMGNFQPKCQNMKIALSPKR